MEDCVVISQLGRPSINFVLALKNSESGPYALFRFGTVGINSRICSAGSAVLKKTFVWLRVFGKHWDIFSYIGGLIGCWMGISVWTLVGNLEKAFRLSAAAVRKMKSQSRRLVKNTPFLKLY
ncbi:hypothetical protein AVEN_79650-1 [Araneus ventricosus]|uniref:Uncharacterized protein n=1 Tax=Araneus ventricosus TaxID=182803 RepID=A0A4Y2K630_ARAVE|nr:hypothetical protein AVEN_79650-1 [Araneus ventricosus]